MTTDRLATVLSRLRRFLEKHQDSGWLIMLGELLDKFGTQPDMLGSRVRQLFGHGGMGGLTDLAITKANGHCVEREQEANFELHAMLDVLCAGGYPEDIGKGPIKHFVTYPSTNTEWEVMLTSGDLETTFDVLLWITYYHADWRWVQEWCLYFTHHSSQDIRAFAVRCLVDLARLHTSLDPGIVLTRLGELMNDPELDVRQAAEEAVGDISSVLNVTS